MNKENTLKGTLVTKGSSFWAWSPDNPTVFIIQTAKTDIVLPKYHKTTKLFTSFSEAVEYCILMNSVVQTIPDDAELYLLTLKYTSGKYKDVSYCTIGWRDGNSKVEERDSLLERVNMVSPSKGTFVRDLGVRKTAMVPVHVVDDPNTGITVAVFGSWNSLTPTEKQNKIDKMLLAE